MMMVAMSSATAAESPQFERILLPLVLPAGGVPGAFGSVWKTAITLRNEGESEAAVFPRVCLYLCECGGNNCLLYRPLPQGGALNPLLLITDDDFGSMPGSLLYVDRSKAADFAINVRLYEESHAAQEFGVELPAVREAEFLDATAWLVAIPAGATARVHLRIYAVESPVNEALVRVRIFPGESSVSSYDEVVALAPPRSGEIPAASDYDAPLPGYAARFLSPVMTGGAETVRLRIDPVTPGLRFWAMASITSNTTQSVTLVTPQ
jgi:hypothetical protein